MSSHDHHLSSDGSIQPGLGPDQPPNDPFELALWSLRRIIRETREEARQNAESRDATMRQFVNEVASSQQAYVNGLAGIAERLILAGASPALVSYVAELADRSAHRYAHLDSGVMQ